MIVNVRSSLQFKHSFVENVFYRNDKNYSQEREEDESVAIMLP